MKTMTFYKAADEASGESFAQWFVETFAPQAVKATPGLGKMHVRTRIDAPALSGQASGMTCADPAPDYDVVAEMWFDDMAAYEGRARGSALWADLASRISVENAVAVTPHIVIGPEDPIAADPASLCTVTLLRWREDIPNSEARRHYDEHEGPAKQVHLGAYRYQRHHVEKMLSGRPMDGVTDFSFLTETDLTERFFPTPEAKQIIVEDIADFLKDAQRMYFSPHKGFTA